jgi:hypothetical protein
MFGFTLVRWGLGGSGGALLLLEAGSVPCGTGIRVMLDRGMDDLLLLLLLEVMCTAVFVNLSALSSGR